DLQRVLARYTAPDGTMAVLGNHDHWVGAEAVAAVIRGAGADIVHNRHRLIRRGAAALAVGGVDDFTHGAVRPRDALRDVPPDVPRVLISHNPDLIEYLPPDVRVDLMLSGHTHNGQVHWPIIGPLTVPSQFGKRYMHGLHRVGECWIYISAGVGSSAMPLRFGNPPEMPILRLVGDRRGASPTISQSGTTNLTVTCSAGGGDPLHVPPAPGTGSTPCPAASPIPPRR